MHFDISKAQLLPQSGGIKASVKCVQKINWTLSVFCFISQLSKKKANGENLACALSGIVRQCEFLFYLLAQKGSQSVWVKRFRDLSWVAILAWLITLHKISLPRRCASVKLWSTWARGTAGREIILTEELIKVQLTSLGDGNWKNHLYWSSQVFIAWAPAQCHVTFSSPLLWRSWKSRKVEANTEEKMEAEA